MSSMDALPTNSRFHRPAIFGVEAEIIILEERVSSDGKRRLVQVTNQHQDRLDPVFRRHVEEIVGKDFFEFTNYANKIFHVLGMSYIDQSSQIELTTPESSCPFETAENIDKQKTILGQILKEFGYHAYSSNSSLSDTFGFHENYQTTLTTNYFDVREHTNLIPHFISRIALVGTGGAGKQGTFTLSPRLTHIDSEVSDNSTSDRGIILDRNTNSYTSIGSRLQAISADHPIDIETTALMLGTTALANRLNELGLLPETSINWFQESTKFDHLLHGFNSKFFLQIVAYQRNLLNVGKNYIAWLEKNNMPDFFGSKVAAVALFEIWESRLNDLELFANSQDLNHLLNWSEWANKLYAIKRMRKQSDITPANGKSQNVLSALEIKKCLELTEINPADRRIANFQERLQASPLTPADWMTAPRAQLREKVLKELNNHPAFTRHNLKVVATWTELIVCDMLNRRYMDIQMPSPFHGTEQDFELIKKHIARLSRPTLPENFRLLASDAFPDFDNLAKNSAFWNVVAQ